MSRTPVTLAEPPALAEAILRRCVPQGLLGRTILGDLREEYAELRRAARGRRLVAWYWREAMMMSAAYVLARIKPSRRRPATGRPSRHTERIAFTMQSLWADLGYAVRGLTKQPVFTSIALATLALGIGANTAIFSVVQGVLLSELPYADPGRLVHVWENNVPEGIPHYQVSPGDYADYAAQNETLGGLGGYVQWSTTYAGGDDPQRLQVTGVTPTLFEVMGVPAQFGRTLRPEDGGVNPVRVVLSDGFWQREFGGDPDVVGRSITLDGDEALVVGVMPPGFQLPTPQAELWFPLVYPLTNQRFARGFHVWYLVGRLKADVTVEQARADLSRIAANLERAYPESNTGHLVTVTPLHEAVVGDVRTPLIMLMAAVGFVLLIVSANIANMTLSRSLGRSKEFALRAALGGSRSRLIRQALTENMLLAFLGGALGLALAFQGIRVLVALSPLALPDVGSVSVNATVLWFTLGVAAIVGVLSGIIPAWSASRLDPAVAMTEGGRGASRGVAQRRIQQGFSVLQMAMAVTLLMGAGLMLRSYGRLLQVDPGFTAERLFTARVSLPSSQYRNAEQTLAFWHALSTELQNHPGVIGVAQARSLPMSGGFGSGLTVDGRDVSNGGVQPDVIYRNVSPNYFAMMGIPMVRGQALSDDHTMGGPRVVLVNETAVRRYWPNDDPIGARIKLGPDPTTIPWIEVIGVVSDVRESGVRTVPEPTVYLPSAQDAPRTQWIVVQLAGDQAGIGDAIRAAVRRIDAALPVYDLQPVKQLMAASIAQERSSTLLLAIFAGLALFIAAIGVYGVIAYNVSQRTHEIGIRMTLGARSREIVALVVRQGLTLAAVAALTGIGVAAAVNRLLERSLFEVSALDPVTHAVVPILLLLVAGVACYGPALRASRLDPTAALREQ
ncbi:MAG: ABC transporter permease [Gemmatimonadetes bacterium]|nr:ABC transporter permease [Gemmatimonadota bacterium]